MRKELYRKWLEEKKYDQGTITAQIYRASRVEEYHGDLDEHFSRDGMAGLLKILSYTKSDERIKRENPSEIPFNGDIYSNIAAYGAAVKRYLKFITEGIDGFVDSGDIADETIENQNSVNVIDGQRIGLERDMQMALRANIQQLEPGMVIIDEGAERAVTSGFIDITARDVNGVTVVIELKAGRAGRNAVGQIISYMGDIYLEEDDGTVRGILVASDFDRNAISAARMVPSLKLLKYSVRFEFLDGHQ
jgi:hypothetical protein